MKRISILLLLVALLGMMWGCKDDDAINITDSNNIRNYIQYSDYHALGQMFGTIDKSLNSSLTYDTDITLYGGWPIDDYLQRITTTSPAVILEMTLVDDTDDGIATGIYLVDSRTLLSHLTSGTATYYPLGTAVDSTYTMTLVSGTVTVTEVDQSYKLVVNLYNDLGDSVISVYQGVLYDLSVSH